MGAGVVPRPGLKDRPRGADGNVSAYPGDDYSMARNSDAGADRSQGSRLRLLRLTSWVVPPTMALVGIGFTLFVHARSIYRLFFTESDPVRALHLAAYVYTRYFAGTGRTTVEAGGTMARVRILGVEVGSHANCLAALAYFRAAAHLSLGGPVEARELGCVTRGDSCCEFELRWTEDES